jgi:hypothetical protein
LNGDGPYIGMASQSLQAAPFDIWYMPDYGRQSLPKTPLCQSFSNNPLP